MAIGEKGAVKGGGGGASPLVDRRRVVQTGIGLTSVSLVGGMLAAPRSARAAPQRSSGPPAIYKLVYDDRQRAGEVFAAAARRSGAPVAAIGADITELWRDDLRRHWESAPQAIAGLTSLEAAYCLEVVARDAGLRTMFRALHVPQEDGRVEHRLAQRDPELEGRLAGAPGDHWAEVLAMSFAAAGSRAGRAPVALDYAPDLNSTRAAPLVSWVIAPLARA